MTRLVLLSTVSLALSAQPAPAPRPMRAISAGDLLNPKPAAAPGSTAGPQSAAINAHAAHPAPAVEDKSITVDPATASYTVKLGELDCPFTIHVTNTATEDAVITDVKTSCGCTVAKLPSKPWRLSPGTTGEFQISVDVRGKTGTLVKTATLETVKGTRTVFLQITVPAPPAVSTDPVSRMMNTQLAQKDRQAVFKGDCARCHAAPTAGLTGDPLFHAACGVCHEAGHRATMVPDLAKLNHATDRDFWRTMIAAGKWGTLMPGFSREMDGPLTKPQIDSLVEYLASKYPSLPAGGKVPAAPMSVP